MCELTFNSGKLFNMKAAIVLAPPPHTHSSEKLLIPWRVWAEPQVSGADR